MTFYGILRCEYFQSKFDVKTECEFRNVKNVLPVPLYISFMLKYCVNFAIDNSIFVDIFRKIRKTTIISPPPKYIAGYIFDDLPSTNANQAILFAFCLSR